MGIAEMSCKFECYYKNNILEISDSPNDGGWIIRTDETGLFRLYEIPQFGGPEQFIDTYTNIVLAIADASKLT